MHTRIINIIRKTYSLSILYCFSLFFFCLFIIIFFFCFSTTKKQFVCVCVTTENNKIVTFVGCTTLTYKICSACVCICLGFSLIFLCVFSLRFLCTYTHHTWQYCCYFMQKLGQCLRDLNDGLRTEALCNFFVCMRNYA